ncbi:hypothetical protein MCL36_16885 [Acinetobacter pittii]|uniref:dimethylamine monooxygenase subunit DmmA family protein n=1 Tax=Acinetobacter pittii TaxID=48296 RepID=UPI001EFD9FC2|nr:dimethylamine monooxygenase subunit DmmA family protein [Acinetobacter pittii]MCG9494202.1 hypothetical protein [Acinetobacter pittii]
MQEYMLSTPVYQTIHDLQMQHGKTLFLVQSSQAIATQDIQQKMQGIDLDNFYIFQDSATCAEQLHTVISQCLSQAQAGWHAVICGDESFIWKADNALRQAGLLKDEIVRISMAGKRQVYCVHCFHIQSSTAEVFCRCEQCGIDLLIRTHFSERLGAYMGVCANAESLGKLGTKEVSHA